MVEIVVAGADHGRHHRGEPLQVGEDHGDLGVERNRRRYVEQVACDHRDIDGIDRIGDSLHEPVEPARS